MKTDGSAPLPQVVGPKLVIPVSTQFPFEFSRQASGPPPSPLQMLTSRDGDLFCLHVSIDTYVAAIAQRAETLI